MIEQVEFHNFKSLRKVRLDLGRLTVLVGANGAGKTSILQGMFIAGRAKEVPAEARPLAADPDQVTRVVERASGNVLLDWSVDWTPDEPRMARTLKTPRGEWDVDTGDPLARTKGEMNDEEADQFFPAALHPAVVHLRQPSAADERPELDPDGSGLATFLSWMAGAHPEAFAAVSRDLSVIVPGAVGVRVRPKWVERTEWEVRYEGGKRIRERVTETVPGHQFDVHFADGRRITSELVSDGTVVAVAVLTLVHAPRGARIILIDDIDQGLHINAQAELIRAVRKILEQNPNLQIVCTSQSPYLLDSVDPTEVRVLALDADRHTHVRPLTEHPDFQTRRFGMQTGELWSTLGESWVLEPKVRR